MKKFAKHFLKVLLATMVASMTVTGALPWKQNTLKQHKSFQEPPCR